MLNRTVVSSLLGTGCHVVADAQRRAVVVDPGLGVTREVLEVVRLEGLDVRAVLLTHGHVDHTWDAAELAGALDVAVHVHADDAYRLADPFGTLGALGGQLAEATRAIGDATRVPERVVTFRSDHAGAVRLDLPGRVTGPAAGEAGEDVLIVHGLHLPGHTEGSTAYLWSEGALVLTGDVLFAGTVGRTDLPGGDPRAMDASLARLAALPPATVVLPGHGPASTVATELATNPFLRTA